MLFMSFLGGDESGQNVVEYGLIVGLTSIILIGIWTSMGPHIETMVHSAVSDERVQEGKHASSEAMYGSTLSSGTSTPGHSDNSSSPGNQNSGGQDTNSGKPDGVGPGT